MDSLRLVSFHCLLILSCGDVERNPGPPPESAPRSEVLRRFTRCIQSELVKQIYQANNHDLPTHLYERDPPGWNKLEEDTIKFENICNIKTGGNETFDKLVKLYKKDVRHIPRDIFDVIVCYEKLRDSKRNPDEAKWKVALENYVSQNKSIKNKQAVIDNLDDNLLIEVLKRAAEKATQGIIGSTDDGVNNIIDAIAQVLDAMEHKTNHTVEKSKSAGKKRQATETVTKIQQVKRNKCFSSKGTGVKGKKKLKVEPGSSAKDCPGDRSNMAVPCAPISEPLFPGCLADVIVPEIAQYQPVSMKQMKGKGRKRLSQGQYKETGVKGGKKLKRTSNKGAINIVTPQELEVQAPQQSERFMNIVEPGSSIEDSQGDQSNMAGFYTNSAELRSLLECFSGSVPKTAHYQDSPPSPPYCHGIVEDSRIDNIQVSENHTVSSFLMDQENLSSAADKFGINYNWGTFSSGIPSSEHISAFSSVNNALHGHTIPQDFIPSTVQEMRNYIRRTRVLEFDTTISDSGELADIMKLLDDF